MMKRDNSGISEISDELLLVGLLIGLTIVILASSMGLFGFLHKSAYVVPDFSFTNVSGHSVVAVFHRAGDPVYFTNTSAGSYRAGFYIDTLSGTYPAVPVSTFQQLSPGDTVYIYYTGSGFSATKNLTGSGFSFLPAGILNVRLIDETNHVLIAQMNKTAGAVSTPSANRTVTTTPLPTANVTTHVTPTITITANVTTNVTTPVSTVTTTVTNVGENSKKVEVKWSPQGLGTVTPPGGNQGASVSVPRYGSQTFVCTPNANKAVLSIKLDGGTVYTGSSIGSSISYTVSNVVEDHTLTVTFG
ncbi:MAG: hypothetical protein WCX63_05700 [Methanoregula sp.]